MPNRQNNILSAGLLRWYDQHRRDLPWRAIDGARVDPYRVLLSEFMLQQTQVVTVIPYFHRFLAKFPDIRSLASADEQDVLKLWQGLGYYSRARNLLKCARAIVDKHAGRVPQTVEQLIDLPGIGRYTAGAIASIAFDTIAPIVDGNVSRVICRLDCIRDDPRDKSVVKKIWSRAEQVLPKKRVGDFNSALMELGATICTPRAPKCLLCPLAEMCEARKSGLQEQIPPARKAKPTPHEHRAVLCIRQKRKWLIEQRPGTGRWAGLWQFVTLIFADERSLLSQADSKYGLAISGIKPLCSIEHQLTHRRYQFDVFVCAATGAKTETDDRRWVDLSELEKFPLSRPQVKIAEFLRDAMAADRAEETDVKRKRPARKK